jgi:hypothetical protein
MEQQGHRYRPGIKLMEQQGHRYRPSIKLMEQQGHRYRPGIKLIEQQGHRYIGQASSSWSSRDTGIGQAFSSWSSRDTGIDQALSSLRIRILLLIKLVRIFDHCLHSTDHSWLHFKPLNLARFTEPDPVFHLNVYPDPASQNNADPVLQLCLQVRELSGFEFRHF